jgi:hypothetical protein
MRIGKISNKGVSGMKNRDRNILLGVFGAFSLVLITLAVFFPTALGFTPVGNTRDVQVPPVDTSAVSRDGTAHRVRTSVTLEVDRNFFRDLSVEGVKKSVSTIMSGLEYERIISPDGMEYVKSELMREFEKQFTPEQLKGLYITDLRTDEVADVDTGGGPSHREEIFEGLFGN